MNSQLRQDEQPHSDRQAAPAMRQGETSHTIGDNAVKAPRRDLPLPPGERTIGARQPHRIHAMAHQIDAERDQEGAQGAVVSLRPGTSTSIPPSRPAAPAVELRSSQGEPRVTRKPIWDKNNFGFWLTVCILISLAFSIVWHALG